MSNDRKDIGRNDKGQRVVQSSNGEKYTITSESLGGLPEGNHRATGKDVDEAERNGDD